MEQLHGRRALITGAAGGLGAYIARALAAQGVDLALSDLPGAPLGELAAELSPRVAVATVPADLTRTDELESLLLAAEAELGPPDILVNNAGLEFVGPFTEQTRSQLEAIVSVNLLALMELTRLALPGMLERGRGHIVNLGSLAGKIPTPYFHTYNATKHAVVGFSHSLRSELADRPVSVSVICPGFISAVGMLGRIEDQVDVPAALGTLPPGRVGEAVVTAIREDRAEVIVNRRPVRPLAALAAAYPEVAQKLVRRAGGQETARQFAAAERPR